MNQERTSSGFRWEPFQHRVLPNGLTVLVREHRTAPLFVSDIWVRVGSRNELPETGGIAHFLEHTLFKGTPTRGVGAIAREIEGFGGRTNAGTSLDYTHYYISGESRNLDQALEIHADVMRRSTLEVTAVDAERSVIVEEIKRSADNPHRVLWDTMMAGLYPGHPYGRPTLGPKENISTNISRDTLNTFFRTWYVPGNMFLLVVGDVDAEAVFRHVEELYGDWTAPTPACRAISLPPRPEAGTLVRRAMDVRRGYLQAAWRTVSQANREDATGLELLGILLGQGRSSRLSASLKERRGIVTSISAGQLSLGEDGIFLVRAEFDPLDEAPVREGIRVEIDRLRREPVSGEELLKAMDMLETLYMRGAETNEGQADILGNALIHDALEHELTYLQRLRAITPERLQRLAVQYLAEEADFTTLAGPRPRSTPLVASAAGSAPNAGVTAWRLDNGMRVIHRYLGGIGLAGATLTAAAGVRHEPAGAGGTSNLMSEMLLKGTRRRDGQQLLWDLERLGAELDPAADPDMLRLSLSAPARTFAQALALMSETVQMPVFPEEAFEVERQKVLGRLKAVDDDMFENTWRLFQARLFVTHPYGRYALGTPESVQALTPAALAAFHAGMLRPGEMVLSIVGDISPDDALRLSGDLFGQIRPRTDAGSGREDATPPFPAESVRAEDHRDRQQAMVCLGWLGPRFDHPDYPAMKVLNAILGGGMSARLFRKVRNEASLAYAVHALFPTRLDGGPLCAVIGTDPSAVDRVIGMVQGEIADLTANGPTADELGRTISYVTGQFALDQAACLRQSHFYAWFEALGAGYGFMTSYPESIRRVTAAAVQRAAATWLRPDRSVVAVTRPPC